MSSPFVVVHCKHGPIIVNVNDRFIAPSIFRHGAWAEDDIDLIAQLLELRIRANGQATFYDVGANIGTHTLALGHRFGTSLSIRAFEAQRQVYHMLCGTIALNGLSQVRCHHNAVSDSCDDVLSFDPPDYASTNNFGGFELLPPERSDNFDMMRQGRVEEVTTVTIDHFDEAVDVIKIDIEGMENIALRGAAQTIARSRPGIFLEILKTDTADVFAQLRALEYDIFLKGGDAIAVPREAGLVFTGLEKVGATT